MYTTPMYVYSVIVFQCRDDITSTSPLPYLCTDIASRRAQGDAERYALINAHLRGYMCVYGAAGGIYSECR